MRWAHHIACMREMRNAYKVLFGKSKGKRTHGDRSIAGRIMLKWILGK